MKQTKKYMSLLLTVLLISFCAAFSVGLVSASSAITFARTDYANTYVQIVDTTSGQSSGYGRTVNLTYANYADDIHFVAYENGSGTFQEWQAHYGASVTNVSASATFDVGQPALDTTYYAVFGGNSSYIPRNNNVAVMWSNLDTCTIHDWNTGQQISGVGTATLLYNTGDTLTFSTVFSTFEVFGGYDVIFGNGSSYHSSVDPTTIPNCSGYIVVTLSSSIVTPAPTPFQHGTVYPFGLSAMLESIITLVIGAVFLFVGILIFMRAPGAWIVGTILFLVGFVLMVPIAFPNIYGLFIFAVESVISVVFLYQSAAKVGK